MVEVLWEDSMSMGRWHTPEEEETWLKDTQLIRSVGYLLTKDAKHVLLYQSQAQQERCAHLRIPSGMVRKIRRLR